MECHPVIAVMHNNIGVCNSYFLVVMQLKVCITLTGAAEEVSADSLLSWIIFNELHHG